MNAFLLKCLCTSGWQRTGQVYWQCSDGLAVANPSIQDSSARAVRFLPVNVVHKAVTKTEASPAREVRRG